jgi:hypothetical protein
VERREPWCKLRRDEAWQQCGKKLFECDLGALEELREEVAARGSRSLRS